MLSVLIMLPWASVASAGAFDCPAADANNGWQDIYWSANAGDQIAQCTLTLSSGKLMTQVVLLDAYTGGDIYRVEISSASQTMNLFSSRVPLSVWDDPDGVQYVYAAQVWANLDAAWSLEKYFSRLVVWLPEGTYTLKVYLYRAAVDEDRSTWSHLIPFVHGEVFLRIASYTNAGDHPGSIVPTLVSKMQGSGAGDRLDLAVPTSSTGNRAPVRKDPNGGPSPNGR